MNRSRQAATLFSASSPVARAVLCHCEPLEPRRPLDASDPVLVLVESISDDLVDAVIPYLWENPNETYFDPHVNGTPGPDNEDDDENGYPDDYYGWNFKSLT